MMPETTHQTPPSSSRHDRPARERSLVVAATAVFAERGYDAATTREVAERAGCSEGLIHRYFGGKQGLLLAVLSQRAEVANRELREALKPVESVEEDIRQLLRSAVAAMWDQRDTVRVMLSRAVVDPEVGATLGRLFAESRAGLIADRLRVHQAAGRISPSVDLESVGFGLAGIAFTGGFMALVVFGFDRAFVDRTLDEAARVIADGISCPERRTGPAGARQ